MVGAADLERRGSAAVEETDVPSGAGI